MNKNWDWLVAFSLLALEEGRETKEWDSPLALSNESSDSSNTSSRSVEVEAYLDVTSGGNDCRVKGFDKAATLEERNTLKVDWESKLRK